MPIDVINVNDPARPLERPITTAIGMTESYSSYQRGWKGKDAGYISPVCSHCSRDLEFIDWQQLLGPDMQTVDRGAKSRECWKERITSGAGPGNITTRRKRKELKKATRYNMESGVVDKGYVQRLQGRNQRLSERQANNRTRVLSRRQRFVTRQRCLATPRAP